MFQGNHGYYSFEGLGEDDTVTQDSNMMMGDPVRFFPRALKNLALVQEIGTI